MIENSKSYKIFTVINYIFIGLLALLCFLPLLHVFAQGLSSRAANDAGMVLFWPVDFTLEAYKYVLSDSGFVNATLVSVARTAVGCVINLFFCIICAYPLSKSAERFPSRIVYVWFFMLCGIVSGGMIPAYLVVKNMGLLDTFWALVIPSAVPTGNIILMLRFFRNLPKELEEAAIVDGASDLTIIRKIYIPCSKASIATIALFQMVGHWNSWFDGMIYVNNAKLQPLATLLRALLQKDFNTLAEKTSNVELLSKLLQLSNGSIKAAQIFITMFPILCVYPFLQKYFAKGIVIGSVKG